MYCTNRCRQERILAGGNVCYARRFDLQHGKLDDETTKSPGQRQRQCGIWSTADVPGSDILQLESGEEIFADILDGDWLRRYVNIQCKFKFKFK